MFSWNFFDTCLPVVSKVLSIQVDVLLKTCQVLSIGWAITKCGVFSRKLIKVSGFLIWFKVFNTLTTWHWNILILLTDCCHLNLVSADHSFLACLILGSLFWLLI